MTAAEMEAAQERAVQREAYYQRAWDAIIHPAHDAGGRFWVACTYPPAEAFTASCRPHIAAHHYDA